MLTELDHLVYATPDLEGTVADLERRLGVRAMPGGQHPGRGTRNALVALSPTTYLEILGPDPAQPAPAAGRWFDIDRLASPRLVTWAAKGTDLARRAAEARARGVELGALKHGGRRRPDGVVLSWQYTDPSAVVADGLVPFFIDWGTSPHPAATAPMGPALVTLRGEHPDPERVQAVLAVLGLGLLVQHAPLPALIATLDGIELR